MNYLQEAIERASGSSWLFMQNNPTTLAQIPGITPLLANVQSTNAAIATTKVQQEVAQSADTQLKKQLRSSIIILGKDIARRGVALASNTNNTTLLSLLNYSDSEFSKSTDSKLVSICQVIRDAANANATALAPYGVTAAMIATLQTTINSFNAAILKVRVDSTGSSETTKQLAGYFKTLNATWKKIDTLVEMLRISHPAFYSEYQKVRKVITRGRTSVALKVKTINAQTGAPEPNVTLAITPANGTKKSVAATNKPVYNKKTTINGGGYLRNLPDGTYNITATKSGFQEATTTISVVNGQSTSVTIELITEQSYVTV
jgi:hypothetical protein